MSETVMMRHGKRTGTVKITNNQVTSIHEIFSRFFFFRFFFYIQTNQNTKYGLCTFLFVFTYIYFMKSLNTHWKGKELEYRGRYGNCRKVDGVRKILFL